MDMANRMHRNKRRRRRMIVPLLCTAFALCACHGPEETHRKNRYAVTDGDEYLLDVFMLAEWAGHIVPQQTNMRVRLSLCEKADGEAYFCDAETKTDLSDVFVLGKADKDGAEQMYFYPYGHASRPAGLPNIGYTCERLSGVAKPPAGEYVCDTYPSGAAEIYKSWAYLAESGKDGSPNPRLVIGSGDNFGVSQSVSSSYDDYPTIQMLNLMGMDVDTFGNHAFDEGLDHLMSLMHAASFSFINANFINVPNNLERTAPYKVFEVPAVNPGEKPLNVGVIAALDSNAKKIISRSALGTITIDNYCPVIQGLEELYNQNVRAFIILAHFTESAGVQEFFNGIFSLDEAFLAQLKRDPTALSAAYPCRSHLIITDDMLDSSSTVPKSEQAAALRLKIHQEIYDSILMVYGPATDEPFLVGMVPGDGQAPICSDPSSGDLFLTYHQDGCVTASDGEDISSMFINHSLFQSNKIRQEAFEDDLTFLKYPSFELDEDGLRDPTSDKHPLWLMEFLHKSRLATRATFRITKKEGHPNALYHSAPQNASAYRTELVHFKQTPVFGKPFNQESYTTAVCDDLLNKDYVSLVPDACRLYYSDYKAYLNKQVSSAPSYEACVDDMLSGSEDVADDMSVSERLRGFQEIWTCLYKIASESVCNFGDYTIAQEDKKNEIRQFSTFITNFVTDTFLRMYKINAIEQIDLVYFGSGTTRESNNFSSIDKAFFETVLPFENSVYLVSFGVNELVEALEKSFNVGIGGAFPSFAGMKLSYTRDVINNEIRYIKELWLHDIVKKTHQLIYLHSSVEDGDCILGAYRAEDKKCVYGEYKKIDFEQGVVDIDSFQDPLWKDHTFAQDSLFNKLSSVSTSFGQALYEKKTLKVAITNYMYIGGDEFPDQSSKSKVELSSVLNEAFKAAFTPDEKSLCRIGRGDGYYDLSSEDILKTNLIKRIYYIPAKKDDVGQVGNDGYAKDYLDNICVPTQDLLAERLVKTDIVPEDMCHYHKESIP